MNKDTLMEIAIHLNIKDLENLCQTNQLFLNICSDPHFWSKKYNQDNLPLSLKNNIKINDQIKDYIATKNTVTLLWLNDKENNLLHTKLGIQLDFNKFLTV